MLDALLTVLPDFGVHPAFEARRECTGFICNRFWAAIKREPLAVVAEGVARPKDVDGKFKVNWHVPAGSFQMDQVGLDVALDIGNHYAEEFSYLPEHVRDLLRAWVGAASSASRLVRASTSIRIPGSRSGPVQSLRRWLRICRVRPSGRVAAEQGVAEMIRVARRRVVILS